jgi:hypothetical protein
MRNAGGGSTAEEYFNGRAIWKVERLKLESAGLPSRHVRPRETGSVCLSCIARGIFELLGFPRNPKTEARPVRAFSRIEGFEYVGQVIGGMPEPSSATVTTTSASRLAAAISFLLLMIVSIDF